MNLTLNNHGLHFDVVGVAPTELLCFVGSSVIKMLLTDKMQALIYILLWYSENDHFVVYQIKPL